MRDRPVLLHLLGQGHLGAEALVRRLAPKVITKGRPPRVHRSFVIKNSLLGDTQQGVARKGTMELV